MPENWKPVVGFDGWYEVSDLGRVRRTKEGKGTRAGKLIMPARTPLGYLEIRLHRDGQRSRHALHVLVALAHVPAPRMGLEVNHRNGDKEDCRATNLEWMTRSENIKHAYDTGLRRRGAEAPGAKLTNDDVRAIRAARGKVAQRALAAQFGVGGTTIHAIQHRQTWVHVPDEAA